MSVRLPFGPQHPVNPGPKRTPPWPDGVRRIVLDEIDSTNAEAARRAREGERGPLWIMGRRQVAGRGRGGRVWTAPEGNLSATYLFSPDCAPAEAALYAFTASLAVTGVLAEAGVTWDGGALKWPNDVIIGHSKVAGILLESSSSTAGKVDWLAIGIGINLVAAPPPSSVRAGGRPPSNLIDHGGRRLTQDEALLHLANGLDWFLGIHRSEGFADGIRGYWIAQAEGLGSQIEVEVGGTRVAGIFKDVDETGRLVLETSDGERLIAAGDVFFPEAA